MKTKLIALVAVAMITLTACGSASGGQSKVDSRASQISVQQVYVDGKTVSCIVWIGYESGAISCDWSK
jgi:predicted small secreted protein